LPTLESSNRWQETAEQSPVREQSSVAGWKEILRSKFFVTVASLGALVHAADARGADGKKADANPPSVEVTYDHEKTLSRKTEVGGLLDGAWKEQIAEICKRAEEIDRRKKAARAALPANHDKNAIGKLDARWAMVIDRWTMKQCSGMPDLNHYYAWHKDLADVVSGYEKIAGVKDAETDPAFHQRYAEIVKNRIAWEQEHKRLLMTNRDGHVIGTFADEKKHNRALTPATYIEKLAAQLKTMEDLMLFIDYFTQYTHDSSDPYDPKKKGTCLDHGDYFQFAEETVQRTEGDKMLGDCDDIAILAKTILALQGKNSFLLELPGHLTCICISEREDKRFDAYDIGQQGLVRNGVLFRRHAPYITSGVSYGPETDEFVKGFATPMEALKSVLRKYYRHPIMKNYMSAWKPDNGFHITGVIKDKPDGQGRFIRERNLEFVPASNLSLHVNTFENTSVVPPVPAASAKR
jgi:hypothetical protein